MDGFTSKFPIPYPYLSHDAKNYQVILYTKMIHNSHLTHYAHLCLEWMKPYVSYNVGRVLGFQF
jgi:hypothetical protein